jgi:gamma-glutamyltranspeptidase/glutathione hydrolase
MGGGGFALVYESATHALTALDFRETAPLAYDPRVHASRAQGAHIGVPGEPAGLLALHRRFGARSFADDASPAIRAAERGYMVTAHLAAALASHRPLFQAPSPLAAIFAPAGQPAGANETLTNLPLAGTLRSVATGGRQAFYEGAVAAEIVSVAQTAGSPLTTKDLASYEPVERTPLRRRWGDFDIATFPPPSAGGIMLLETLGMYSKQELVAFGLGTPGYQHMLAEAMRGAIADRIVAIGDPARVPDPSAALLAEDRLRARRAMISSERTHAPQRFALQEGGTSHLVVADRQGNIVSLTTTINDPFGSGVLAPKAGVLLNDELADFTPPEVAMRFGLRPADAPNAPRAGARPTSSMMPTIAFEGGVPVLALGGSGGWRIANNVTEAAIARLAFGVGAAEAVRLPRFFTPPSGPVLAFGPGQMPSQSALLDLSERGEQVQSLPWDETAVQAITWTPQAGQVTRVEAAGDPRKGGVGLVE